jgi:hypothetical protein
MEPILYVAGGVAAATASIRKSGPRRSPRDMTTTKPRAGGVSGGNAPFLDGVSSTLFLDSKGGKASWLPPRKLRHG